MIEASAIDGLPEVRPGDDLAAMIVSALSPEVLADDDVLVVAHKVVSKSEGAVRSLATVIPDARATELAALLGKDPRHIQVILDQTREVRRAERSVLICVTHHGFVCANAGVDASNAGEPDTLTLLPRDPDRSARTLRARLRELTGASPALLITDSFGRPWRTGQSDVAIGCAGLVALDDWRGREDARGRELKATAIAVADELAGAADLARAKDADQPAILVRGAGRFVTAQDGPGVLPLIRADAEDLFR
ncbi:MAG TPA: coenzyme F420-0:L-glutamate ligase [Solirubrobacteraceae bacterium]|jgi:coenzyme F420-0:L-glutamate ligase/coenzyme F420-1:gamma-L-glutamate ligase